MSRNNLPSNPKLFINHKPLSYIKDSLLLKQGQTICKEVYRKEDGSKVYCPQMGDTSLFFKVALTEENYNLVKKLSDNGNLTVSLEFPEPMSLSITLKEGFIPNKLDLRFSEEPSVFTIEIRTNSDLTTYTHHNLEHSNVRT